MSIIEEEIKQKKFASEYQKMSINILFSASWLSSSFNQLLKPYNISQEQYNVLRILRGQHPSPCSIQTICERMIDHASNASRIVERLRLKNYIFRSECEADRRLVDIVITDDGLSFLSNLDVVIESWDNHLNSVTEAEAKELNRILDKLRSKT